MYISYVQLFQESEDFVGNKIVNISKIKTFD